MRLASVAASANLALAKVRRARQDGTLTSKLRRRAVNALYVPAWSIVAQRRLSSSDRALELGSLFADHRGSSHALTCSDDALRRLAKSFQIAESGWATAPPELRVRGVWAEWLDVYYSALRNALRAGAVAELREMLENMHRTSLTIGVGGSIDDVTSTARWAVPGYYRSLWSLYSRLLRDAGGDPDDVTVPCVGNPHGVAFRGRFVQLQTFRHAYHATKLLSALDRPDQPDVDILEIGGGLGGQAIQFFNLGATRIRHYTIIDLPEVSALVGFALMAALGEHAVRLYGESTSDDHRVTIIPPWEIDRLADQAADLVFNAYSFAEMDGETSTHYLEQVERVSRRFFFHVNHETRFRYRQPDGSVSLNRLGSELVPRSDWYQLRERVLRRFVRPEQRNNIAFEYLFERARDPGRS